MHSEGVPLWQRVISGLLAILGAVAVSSEVIHGHASQGLLHWVSLAVAAYGDILFGFIALRGHTLRGPSGN